MIITSLDWKEKTIKKIIGKKAIVQCKLPHPASKLVQWSIAEKLVTWV